MNKTETENQEPLAGVPVSADNGLQALHALTAHLAAGPRAQFSHRFVATEKPYVVRHDPAGCPTCAHIATIEQALLAARNREAA